MAKKKRASTTKYHAKYVPLLAEMMAGAGLLNKDMAEILDINPDTLYRWQKVHPEFGEAVKRGKENPDKQVTATLFKEACGYWVEETDDEYSGDGRLIKRIVHKRWIRPMKTAYVFWLKNRLPALWKDRQDIHLVDETLALFAHAFEEYGKQQYGLQIHAEAESGNCIRDGNPALSSDT